ncbi:MAG TPA: SRPBCC family protein [Methylococcaceae bacterium]|jgi:mxaD protein|nr:SRPBCC family protein [Methylococcaceae bacterium]HIN69070.1 SRPBCC family protein [Methylococcales bacterium]HIA44842.1 SRPBCC family protein [Methylococcaceae bacterium]HIB62354.1 SRPBCC family protein [Methylococcaceae bacterium]HIO12437.1 SRPBCC family protein [Methylococcales bacterium]
MKKVFLILSVLFFIFMSTAQAHGPVRGKLTATVKINAPAEKVWAVIKNFDDMAWHPGIASTKAKGGNKKKATRILTLKGGGTITEQLKAYKGDKMSYKYKITDMSTVKTITHAGKDEIVPVLPVNNYAATLSVKGKGGSSEVKWVATYYRGYLNNNPPSELNETAADNAVTAVFKVGLTNLLSKFQSGAKDSAIKFKVKR